MQGTIDGIMIEGDATATTIAAPVSSNPLWPRPSIQPEHRPFAHQRQWPTNAIAKDQVHHTINLPATPSDLIQNPSACNPHSAASSASPADASAG